MSQTQIICTLPQKRRFTFIRFKCLFLSDQTLHIDTVSTYEGNDSENCDKCKPTAELVLPRFSTFTPTAVAIYHYAYLFIYRVTIKEIDTFNVM